MEIFIRRQRGQVRAANLRTFALRPSQPVALLQGIFFIRSSICTSVIGGIAKVWFLDFVIRLNSVFQSFLKKCYSKLRGCDWLDGFRSQHWFIIIPELRRWRNDILFLLLNHLFYRFLRSRDWFLWFTTVFEFLKAIQSIAVFLIKVFAFFSINIGLCKTLFCFFSCNSHGSFSTVLLILCSIFLMRKYDYPYLYQRFPGALIFYYNRSYIL